jgi:prevent-host-death family protein
MSKPIPIGAYEAKTHLPRLLREVEAGQSFTISVRGKPVAELRPVASAEGARADFGRRMRAFMERGGRPPMTADEIKALIEEGRD